MLKELAVERFAFACHGCGNSWTADYDVQHIEDGHGLVWEYYSLNGVPVTAPTAPDSVNCPNCGATWIGVDLVAVREIPLGQTATGQADPTRPRQQIDPDRQTARQHAPLLHGDQPNG